MRAAAVVALTLACAVPAHAAVVKKTPPCALTDPAGDVVLNGTTTVVPADHVDLRRVDVMVTATTMSVTFQNTASNPNRLGVWRLTFRSGKTTLYVVASDGAWASVGGDDAPGYRAGVSGKPPTSGFGYIDENGLVRAIVPLSAFGGAAPKRGTVLSHFAATAAEKFVTVSGTAEVSLMDTASWPAVFTVGGGCHP